MEYIHTVPEVSSCYQDLLCSPGLGLESFLRQNNLSPGELHPLLERKGKEEPVRLGWWSYPAKCRDFWTSKEGM